MSRLARFWRRKKLEHDLGKELQFHIAERVSAFKSMGLSEDEARRKVRQEFGGMEQVKEECREARGTLWLESTIQDLRYTLRSLRKTPGFTCTAILTRAGYRSKHGYFYAGPRGHAEIAPRCEAGRAHPIGRR